MDQSRIAAALKTLADRMDVLPAQVRLSTRDQIIAVVYGDGDAFTDEFARIWEQDGPGAAKAWAEDVHQLYTAVFAAAFPGSEPFRFVPGDELRALADQIAGA